MIEGEKETGYSFHYINHGIDTGNIILQKKIRIEDWDTQLSLYQRIMFESMKDFEDVVSKVLLGFKGIKQENKQNITKRVLI